MGEVDVDGSDEWIDVDSMDIFGPGFRSQYLRVKTIFLFLELNNKYLSALSILVLNIVL